MNSGGVDSNGLLSGHIWTILKVIMLALLLRLEPETRETTEVLLTDGLVDGGTTTNTLAVVVSNVGPPVCLGLDVPQNHVLDGLRKARNLPWDVGFPAAPCLRKMLEDGPGLVGLDTLRHHVENVVHHRCTELEIKVRLHALLRDRLGDTLRVTSFELAGEEIS